MRTTADSHASRSHTRPESVPAAQPLTALLPWKRTVAKAAGVKRLNRNGNVNRIAQAEKPLLHPPPVFPTERYSYICLQTAHLVKGHVLASPSYGAPLPGNAEIINKFLDPLMSWIQVDKQDAPGLRYRTDPNPLRKKNVNVVCFSLLEVNPNKFAF